MRRWFIALVIAATTVWACSEATDGLIPMLDASASMPTDTPDADDSASGDKDSGKSTERVDASTSSTGTILLNEVSSDKEWIELTNSGSKSVDISGWQVADSDKDTGGPKLEEAVTFPAGTTLGPHEYGLVQAAGVGDAGKNCPDGDHAFCVHAEFGISKKSGENLYLLAKDGGVVGTVVYPPDASMNTDQSWSRIPDGDPKGTFELAAPTPGAANEANE